MNTVMKKIIGFDSILFFITEADVDHPTVLAGLSDWQDGSATSTPTAPVFLIRPVLENHSYTVTPKPGYSNVYEVNVCHNPDIGRALIQQLLRQFKCILPTTVVTSPSLDPWVRPLYSYQKFFLALDNTSDYFAEGPHFQPVTFGRKMLAPPQDMTPEGALQNFLSKLDGAWWGSEATQADLSSYLTPQHSQTVLSEATPWFHALKDLPTEPPIDLDALANESVDFTGKLNILYLYSTKATHIHTMREYMESFTEFSRHRFDFAAVNTNYDCDINLDAYDVVLVHYSVRLITTNYFSAHFAQRLKNYSGFKALFIQDEYTNTETSRQWMVDLGLHTVFTCVPQASVEKIYPRERYPAVDFQTVLTGYIPYSLKSIGDTKALKDRQLLIGYRGRKLPYSYGELAHEKMQIGVEMKRICESKGLPVDIEWEDSKRIYGSWYDFLQNCRATLATESGSNTFDFDGNLKVIIREALEKNPDLTFQEAYDKWIKPHDYYIKMNQVSPKIFESIALRTALVCFEGEYSGVIQPNLHFLPLKKDYSNVEEILEKLHDDEFIEAMTQRAYTDVIESGKYSYATFVNKIDTYLEKRVRRALGYIPVTQTVAFVDPVRQNVIENTSRLIPSAPLDHVSMAFGWRHLEAPSPQPQNIVLKGLPNQLAHGYRVRSKSAHKTVLHTNGSRKKGLRSLTRAFTPWKSKNDPWVIPPVQDVEIKWIKTEAKLATRTLDDFNPHHLAAALISYVHQRYALDPQGQRNFPSTAEQWALHPDVYYLWVQELFQIFGIQTTLVEGIHQAASPDHKNKHKKLYLVELSFPNGSHGLCDPVSGLFWVDSFDDRPVALLELVNYPSLARVTTYYSLFKPTLGQSAPKPIKSFEQGFALAPSPEQCWVDFQAYKSQPKVAT